MGQFPYIREPRLGELPFNYCKVLVQILVYTEASTGGVLLKKVFLKISQISGKHLFWSLFLIRHTHLE